MSSLVDEGVLRDLGVSVCVLRCVVSERMESSVDG